MVSIESFKNKKYPTLIAVTEIARFHYASFLIINVTIEIIRISFVGI